MSSSGASKIPKPAGVLEAVAVAHPSKVVAEAARKATFRLASAPAHLSAARGGVTTPRHRAA